jgi:hypothetical protein
MVPRTQDGGRRGYEGAACHLVTDEERSDDDESDPAAVPVRRGLASSLVQGLPWMKPHGDALPKVGQRCLVVTGESGQDVGQMGRVTRVMAVMMEIAYRHGRDGLVRIRRKRPSSVIMLEDGLELAQEPDGTVWVRRTRSGEWSKPRHEEQTR